MRISLGAFLLFVTGLAGQQSNSYQGSTPGAVSPAPLTLTLLDAIQRGLKSNLGLLESDTASETARAARMQALSALLPQVTGTLAENDEQLNLKTVGLNVPPNPYVTIRPIAGPFSYTAAQANVSAKVLDWSARRNLKSARANEEASKLSVQASRDLVVQAVANTYLGVIADGSRVESIKAQVETDQALYKRAADQKTAGLAAGIDVLRAQVQLKTEQQALLAQQNQFEKDKLALGRIIGLAPAQVFQIADTAPFSPISGIAQDEALRTALAQRPDYLSAKRAVEAAQQALAAAQAEWYPTVDLSGYYGDAGPTLANSHGVFVVTGALNFNIFNGGRIRADIEKARAALKDRSDELASQSAQIEVDVRNAFLDLQSAADQVAVARDNLGLANQTLEQARDRFTSGVTDNIEVVQAQGSVAIANDNLISALYAHNLAKVSLAKAMGLTEQGVKRFIEVK
ncbi:MAG: TolC family protein [Bryobacteraceae bacterium]|jgi:outer membrane protein TolC